MREGERGVSNGQFPLRRVGNRHCPARQFKHSVSGAAEKNRTFDNRAGRPALIERVDRVTVAYQHGQQRLSLSVLVAVGVIELESDNPVRPAQGSGMIL